MKLETEKRHDRVRALISRRALEENFAAMHGLLAPGVKMAAVIKADAYGHGAVSVAHLIQDYDYIWGFAVATAQEAMTLREAGIRKPILILGLVFGEDLTDLAREDVRITVSDFSLAQAYARAGEAVGRPVSVHLALDTGMSRIGFADSPESIPEIERIAALPGLSIEGLFTHFARADEAELTPAQEQLHRYQAFAALLEEAGITIPLHHCSNSAGILRFPEAHLQMVRAGITIYGIYPSRDVEWELPLKPVMELKSRVSYLKTVQAGTAVSYGGIWKADRPTRLATIPVGYADGYPRQLSGKGWVLIHGQKAPIRGRVCMDQFMVDVTDIPGVAVGDEVTLMGRDGDAFLGVDTLGELSGRFPYEFVCDISSRVPRVYV